MCAIAGLYAFAPSAPPADRAELRTTDPMSARGPDGHGEWFSNNGRVALGHRRLAIIDLTEGGAQPMHSADGQLVITFNGEIYNYRELRKELPVRSSPRHRPAVQQMLQQDLLLGAENVKHCLTFASIFRQNRSVSNTTQ